MSEKHMTIVTAGSAYLDIDAYACMVAMTELLRKQGINALAYSQAPCNYSVCSSLVKPEQIAHVLPPNVKKPRYIIVDVSDPHFLCKTVPLDQVSEVYDHHTGFEAYWQTKIGTNAHIEFVGAAATLVYRRWKYFDLQKEMSVESAKLLIAAILDNTLNLFSESTSEEDIMAYEELCQIACVTDQFKADYFSEVQCKVEADLQNALLNDIKYVSEKRVLPPKMAQLCVWNAKCILECLTDIRRWLWSDGNSWLLNLIEIKSGQGYFICDNSEYQNKLKNVFDVSFVFGVAWMPTARLRKEIIKKVQGSNLNGEKIW